jgi:4-azaleucine resistance transporter AzlC
MRGMSGPALPTFRSGLATALPIAMGYFPIAFAFGVAASDAGLRTVEAVALSVIIYAGASQFLALALITAGAPLLVAAFTLVAMNLRHVLYGPALLKAAGAQATTRHAWAWGWGLTDEVFGAALGEFARGRRFSERFMFGLGLGAYVSWIAGTAVGGLAGGKALDGLPALQAGLSFMLPALFLSLLLSILTRPQIPAIAVAGLATLGATVVVSATTGILAGMVIGALAGTLRWRNKGGAA